MRRLRLLNSLPRLTSLNCTNIQSFGAMQLLGIAAHSSLEEVHVHNSRLTVAHEEFIGRRDIFPEESEQAQCVEERPQLGQSTEGKEEEKLESAPTELRDEAGAG